MQEMADVLEWAPHSARTNLPVPAREEAVQQLHWRKQVAGAVDDERERRCMKSGWKEPLPGSRPDQA